MVSTAMTELTPRQEEALAKLRRLRLPAAPPLKAGLLVPPPGWYRLAPVGSLAAAAVLLCLLVLPFIKVSETWIGTVSLRSGSVVQLLTPGTQTIRLPEGQGALRLEGPATLEFTRLKRHLLSGRIEGDLRLKEGRLLFQAGPAFLKTVQIQTPLLILRVKGTRFLIGHGLEQGSRLQVLEGTVWVKPAGSGDRWMEAHAGTEVSMTPGGTFRSRAFSQHSPEDAPSARSQDQAAGPEAGAPDSQADPSSPTRPGMLWREQE